MNSGTTTLLVALGAVGLAGWFYTRDKAEDEPEPGTDPETGETIRTPADDLADALEAHAKGAGWAFTRESGGESGLIMEFSSPDHPDAALAALVVVDDGPAWTVGESLGGSWVPGASPDESFPMAMGLPVASLTGLTSALSAAGFSHTLVHHGVGPEHYTFVDVSRTDGSVVGSVHLDAQGMVSTSDPTLGALLQALPPLPPL